MRWLLALALSTGLAMAHPDNLVDSSGFEVAPDPWTYDSPAVRSTDQAHEGTHSALVVSSSGNGGSATSATFALANGNTYALSLHVFPDSASTTAVTPRTLTIQVDRGDGTPLTVATLAHTGYDADTWSKIAQIEFTANGTVGHVVLQAATPFVGSNRWYVDAVEVFPVAIKLAERPVAAVVALLQAQLATELTAIDTDRADAITMVAPAAGDYSAYEREVVDGKDGAAHVEVFEGPIGFNDPYEVAVNRAVYDCPINIRVTYFARIGTETLSDIRTRCRRYTAGIYNVIGQNRALADSDDATQLITANRVLPITEINAQKVQQIVEAVVRCEEDYA